MFRESRTIKNMYDVERKKKCLDLFRPFSPGEKTDEIDINNINRDGSYI